MEKRKFVLAVTVLALCIVFAGCASSSASAGQADTILIVNATGYTVWYVLVSPSENDTWGKDLLDSEQILPNGESFSYQLPRPLSKAYDIRLVDSDEDSYTKWRVNVSDNPVVIFTFEDYDKPEDD